MENNNEVKIDLNETDTKPQEQLEVYDAVLKGNIYVKSENAKVLHERGYYGRLNNENAVEFESIEALLLLERKRIRVRNEEGKEYTFEELSEHFVNNIPNFWKNYLVYKDLRSRGYIVRSGYGEDIEFRVYERGAVIGENTAKYLIHTIIEGIPLKLSKLSKITQIAKSSRKKLILTVIDRNGDVTYYQCKKVSL